MASIEGAGCLVTSSLAVVFLAVGDFTGAFFVTTFLVVFFAAIMKRGCVGGFSMFSAVCGVVSFFEDCQRGD